MLPAYAAPVVLIFAPYAIQGHDSYLAAANVLHLFLYVVRNLKTRTDRRNDRLIANTHVRAVLVFTVLPG